MLWIEDAEELLRLNALALQTLGEAVIDRIFARIASGETDHARVAQEEVQRGLDALEKIRVSAFAALSHLEN